MIGWMFLLSGCGMWSSAPSAETLVDVCVEAHVVQKAAQTSDPTGIALGCAAVYKEPLCRQAWLSVTEGQMDFIYDVVSGCAAAYCPDLEPTPAVCGGDLRDLRTVLVGWPELQRAIWAKDLPPEQAERMRVAVQGNLKK
jgi:hypothetical protein